MSIIERYLVPPFKISIICDKSQKQLYKANPLFETSRYLSFSNHVEKKILSENHYLDSEIVKLDLLLNYLKKEVMKNIEQSKTSFPNKKSMLYLRDWIAYRIIGFDKIIPLLVDDLIQEIYLDKPGTSLYLDHQKYGRCLTNIFLSESDLSRIKSRLCIEKDTVLNYLNPSLKAEIKTKSFHVRAAVDIPPLAADGLSMNIRKLRNRIWTLPELVNNKMLSIESAAYLLFSMMNRTNMTIIGEPGSGKTTLANAIDFLTPNSWRKISVEDVVESLDQTSFGKFQTRYSVSPFENNLSTSTKSSEIIKLLHRSPTWVFLGEIQTSEHSKALFEALSAGLVGIQTCHGRTIELMLLRWINQHNIPLSSLLALDTLIEVSSSFHNWRISRKVSKITEISKVPLQQKTITNSLTELETVDVFKYNHKIARLERKIDLFETPVIENLKQNFGLTKNRFQSEINRLTKVLSYLVKNQLFDPKQVLSLLSNNSASSSEREVKTISSKNTL